MAKRKLPAPLKATEVLRNDIAQLQKNQAATTQSVQALSKQLGHLLNTVEMMLADTRYEPTTDYPGKAGSGMCDSTPLNVKFEDPRKDGAYPDTDWGKGLSPNAGECTAHSTSKTGEPMKTFSTGAVRGTGCMIARYDLINPVGLRRLAETYAEGALKYGDSNWQKGIDTPNLLNHAITHIESWRNGDRSEDHMAHAVWNLFTIMYTEERLPHLVIRHYAPGFDPDKDPTNIKLK